MPDPTFAHSVILILPHATDFPLVIGLIVNEPIAQLPLNKLFPDSAALKSRPDTAFFGGPVDVETPAIIFRSAKAIDQATALAGDVQVSLDPGLAAEIAQAPKRAHDFRLVLGRAQWLTDQLHDEIMQGAWYMVSVEADMVFSTDPGKLWDAMVARARWIPAAANIAPSRVAPALLAP
jgi:putative transcriptional regulator